MFFPAVLSSRFRIKTDRYVCVPTNRRVRRQDRFSLRDTKEIYVELFFPQIIEGINPNRKSSEQWSTSTCLVVFFPIFLC